MNLPLIDHNQNNDLLINTSNHENIFTENPYTWLIEKIKPVAVCNTPARDIKIREIKPLINEWKQLLNNQNASQKKILIKNAVNWVTEDKSLTIDQMSLILHILEKLALSRKISSLNEYKLYERSVEGNKNHVITLKGLKQYISYHYPQLDVIYTNNPCNNSLKLIKENLKPSTNTWVVLQHKNILHKTLLHVSQNDEGCMNIYIWDSLGITNAFPKNINCGEKLRTLTRNLITAVFTISGQDPRCHVACIKEPRQKDGVNCSSIVLYDLENAMELMENNEPICSDELSPDSINHPAFYDISQYSDPKKCNAINDAFNRMLQINGNHANSSPTIISAYLFTFFVNNVARYADPGYCEPDDSETDQEDNGCCIM